MLLTIGANGKTEMEELLKAKFVAKPTPLVDVGLSGKGLAPLLKVAGMPEDKAITKSLEKISQMERINVANVKVHGGERLTIRLELGLAPLLIRFESQRIAAEIERQKAIKPGVERK